jgi:3-isopropylmalate/(R)-2-methylmalate dehydratase small subunit
MLPVRLTEEEVETIFERVRRTPLYRLTVDLEKQRVTSPDGLEFRFEVEEFRRHCLLNGLDDIGLTLKHEDQIRAYEAAHPAISPRALSGKP